MMRCGRWAEVKRTVRGSVYLMLLCGEKNLQKVISHYAILDIILLSFVCGR